MMNKRHEILVRAISMDEMTEASELEIRCSCGIFILSRQGEPAEVSLIEITQLVAAHYVQMANPEQSNGSAGLIKGKR